MKRTILLILMIGIFFSLTGCKNKNKHEHKLVNFEEKLPTCTDKGYEAYEKCEECDYTTYQEIDKLGHSLEHHELIDATCTLEGMQEYWYCTECETYFNDEFGTSKTSYNDLKINKIEHSDKNSDLICDYNCGKILLNKEALQQIINNTLSLNKVTIKENYIPTADETLYYLDDNLLYLNNYLGEMYYYTTENVTYLFKKTTNWSKTITSEVLTYNITSIFSDKYNLEVASDISLFDCTYGLFEGETMFSYTNSSNTTIDIKLNDAATLLEGIYIHDEYGNIISMFELTYGENSEILSMIDEINSNMDGYEYNVLSNTYLVYSSNGILNATSNAKKNSSSENPATFKLMNDIVVEAKKNEYDQIEYAILIETGNIIIDLNGNQLSALNSPFSVIQIGKEWGELCDAVVTIEDNSSNQNGKILAEYIGIYNQGGTLIFNNGIIEVNNTIGDWVANGICMYLGTLTINGGLIVVNSVSEMWITAGIYFEGNGGTLTMNDGYICVNGPFAEGLHLRSTNYINGGTIESNKTHIYSDKPINFGTNDEGIGVTFIGGLKSFNTLNSLLTEGVGYYDANGNLIEVGDDVKEIVDKGDITIKKLN